MNKQQYKRFFLVLVLPLMGLGLWLAEMEIIFNQTIQATCYPAEQMCISGPIPKGTTSTNAGMFLSYNARLPDLFHEKVITTGISEMEFINGALQEKKKIGAGKTEDIVILKSSNLGNGIDNCRLDPFANTNGDLTGEWSLQCYGALPESFNGFSMLHFKFVNESTNLKYQKIYNLATAEHKQNYNRSMALWIISFLAPLGVLLLAFGLIRFLIKIVLFIKHGKNEGPIAQ
jgi:hypothetical protein